MRILTLVLAAAAILALGYFLGWAADVAILDGPVIRDWVSGRVSVPAPAATTTPPALQPLS